MTTVVIGAGIAGLVCARSLAAAGEDVRVLEGSDRAGGVLRTERRDGYLLELGPNTVRPTPEIARLVEELILSSEALDSDPALPRFLALDGRLHRLPSSPAEAVRTEILSVRGKLRLAMEPLVSRRRDGAEESIRAFFSRRIGPEAADRLVAPFVSGIFAGDPGRLSAESCFPALTRGERERGSLLPTMAAGRRAAMGESRRRGLLSFRDGLETLPRALAAVLGDRLQTGVSVVELSPSPARGGWSVRTQRERLAADRVVLACPAGAAARLVSGFAPEAAAALSGILHPPLAVMHFSWPSAAFPRPLRGFGHLSVPSPGRRVLGAVWSSALFPGRAPRGFELVTAFVGGASDPEAAALPDERLGPMAGLELSRTLEASEPPRLLAIQRWDRSIPQYEIGHGERMETLSRTEARWEGLRFLGSYRGGVSVGDVVRSALATAGALRPRPERP